MTNIDKIIDGKLEMLKASCEQAINDGNADESFLTASRLAYEEIISALRQPSSDQVLAEIILKCRDALIQADYTEAWHWLYQLQEKVGTGHDPYKPWEHLERMLAAAEAQGRKL